MSLKRDKFLESAQKFIVKGQIDRAIKDYEQVVALDPGDIRHRQRLAELLVRASRTIEAIGEYEAIGKYYADNGFYLKAIAVYKQVQKLDPEDIKTCVNLASLNEKQGLTGNALAEYGKACSYFEKNGKPGDLLRILESMITVDPENLVTRQKYAETRCALGQKDEAYEDFRQTAILLRRRGDEKAYGQVVDRVRQLYPDKKDFELELISAEIKSGNAPLAIRHLQELTGKDQGNLKAWTLLLDACLAAGAAAEFRDALMKMNRIFPDDPGVKERLMQSALEEGDVDGGLVMLEQNAEFFASRGELHVPERIYKGLLGLAPHDARLLKGLVTLYERGGDEEKLRETVERLESLDAARSRTDEAPGSGLSADADSEAAVTAYAPDEPEGGEGSLPLSLAADGDAVQDDGDRALSAEAAAADAAAVDSDFDGGAASGDEHEFPLEVDLELEFPDDERAELPSPYVEESAGRGVSAAEDSREEVEFSDPLFVKFTSGSALDEVPVTEEQEEGFVELSVDALFEQDEGADEVSVGADAEGAYTPDKLFSGFKKGLGEQLEQGDTETRYNLGIAFKEMGLFDEAMTEFEAAASDPQRRIDCLTLQGICCRDKGDFARAEEIFKNGIAQEGLSEEEYLSITYELALLYENAGRTGDALDAYRLIQGRQQDFRETQSRIARLQGGEDLDELELVELEQDDLV